jgi:hypothetical protein
MTVRRVFLGFSAVLVLMVVAQFFLAASSAFDTAPHEESFQYHRLLGFGLVLFAILSTIVAAIARMPGRILALTGLVAGLGVVQAVIAMLAGALDGVGGTLVFGLHALNGLFILKTAGSVARQARVLARPAVESAQPSS